MRILALLDEGSTVTLIDAKIVREIGVTSSRIHVALKGVGKVESIINCNEKVNLKIKGISATYPFKNVLVVNNLALPIQAVNRELADFCALRTGV